MKIVWDERKRIANLAKHGLDFADVSLFNWRAARIEEAKPGDDRRSRMKAVGEFEGRVVVIIFSMLGMEAISVISFRRANATERMKLL